MNDCLGIGLSCSDYDFAFTIIDFLTIIGLFFAGYQLIKPINKLRLIYYSFFNHWILWFCGMALFCSLIPIVLKFIPGKAIPIVGYDIFREILGVIIMLVTGIIAFIQANKPISTVKNIDRLKEILIFYLGQGDKEIEALGYEFGYFIEDVVKKVDDKNPNAYSLLLLCKNKRLIKNLIIKNISSFDRLLRVYYKRLLTGERHIENLHKDFIKIVINESLNNDDSILSKEIKGEIYEGFNNGKGIISGTIFNNFKFIHDYDLLDRDGYKKPYLSYNLSDTFGNNYSKFWELCIDSFFDSIENMRIDYYQDLCGGLCKFSGFKGIIYNKIIKGDFNVDNLFHLILRLTTEIENKILKTNIDSSLYYRIGEGGFLSLNPPKDFVEAISRGCYLCLDAVAQVKETVENTELINHCCDMLYGGKFSPGDLLMESVRDNVNSLVLGEIKYMNSRGMYPNMTRVFFHVFGWKIFYERENLKNKEKEFIIEVLKIVSESLESFSKGCFWNIKNNDNIDSDLQKSRDKKLQEIIDDFLPNYMSYSYEEKTLTFYSMWGIEKSVLDLNELKNDKIVILNQNNN